MLNKNTLKLAIPIIAVLVLVESVILVSNLNKKPATENMGTKADIEEMGENLSVVSNMNQGFGLKLVKSSQSPSVGQENYFDVLLQSSVAKNLDAISVYVKSESDAVSLERVEVENNLPRPILAKISRSGDVALVNYLISSPSGYAVEPGKEINLMRVFYTPQREGKAEFKVITEGGEAETMLVETGKSQVIPFNSDNLSVSISE